MNRREIIQKEATDSIIANKYNGMIVVAPRVGKSKLTLEAIRSKTDWNIYISSPYESINKSWSKEISLWKIKNDLNLICHKSLSKIPKDLDLLILDECQMLSIGNIRTIQKKTPKRILLLTGTANYETRFLLGSNLNTRVIYEYSFDEAINERIIANFKVKVLRLPLDDINVNIPSGTKKVPKVTTLKKHYDFVTNQFEKFKELSQRDATFYGIKEYYARERMKLIYKSEQKINLSKELFEIPKCCLLFAGNIDTANFISEFTYHSKNKKDNNLEKFISGEIDRLGVVNSSSMGITIPQLKHIVVQQMQSNSEMSIQKIMRACNLDPSSNKDAEIVIICLKDTVDEEWSKKALEEVNDDRIEYIDYNSNIDISKLFT